jgi:hypothetical protein
LNKRNFIDKAGMVFGNITVLGFEFYSNGNNYFKCKCICGKVWSVKSASLTRIRSCGCRNKRNIGGTFRRNNVTHGRTKTPEYLC